MTLHAVHATKAQLTLDLEPGLVERFPTAMDCLRASVYAGRDPLKTIAAEMDLSASALSRKLAQDPDDPRRFSLDDLEHYINATGDTAVVEYLATKYLQSKHDWPPRFVPMQRSMADDLALRRAENARSARAVEVAAGAPRRLTWGSLLGLGPAGGVGR